MSSRARSKSCRSFCQYFSSSFTALVFSSCSRCRREGKRKERARGLLPAQSPLPSQASWDLGKWEPQPLPGPTVPQSPSPPHSFLLGFPAPIAMFLHCSTITARVRSETTPTTPLGTPESICAPQSWQEFQKETNRHLGIEFHPTASTLG